MQRNTRLQTVAVLAIGLLGGYLAAAGRFPSPPRAEAAPPQTPAVTPVTTANCCEGADRGLTLTTAAAPTDLGGQPAGRKPNILVIFGDDIGITNLSCYSDGLMGTKRRTSIELRKTGYGSFIITASKVAPPADRRFSRASTSFAPDCPRSVSRAPRWA
jgi:hypothetical protein